jgi:hypothetical protein
VLRKREHKDIELRTMDIQLPEFSKLNREGVDGYDMRRRKK